jgi:GT2 family glycosyltransferase
MSLETTTKKNISSTMPQPRSVASVTVATNACHLLPRQLDALRQQSPKIDEIIVVDNASTDGTVEMLSTRHPDVTVLRLPENGGVGGAYAAGLRHAAFSKRHDWIWLLDDDSVPPGDGLESLLAGLQQAGEAGSIAVLAPVCVDPETSVSWPGLSWQDGRLTAKQADPAEPLIFVDCVISSGSLIHRDAVEAVGLPRADFFMDFVDYEYCLRLRRHGFRVAIVRDTILEHEVGGLTTVHLLGLKKSWSVHAPWREYYMARNETFTMWQYYPKLVTKGHVLYRLTRHAIGILLFGKQKLDCLAMQWRGFMDGRAGKLGIRFLPEKSPLVEPERH